MKNRIYEFLKFFYWIFLSLDSLSILQRFLWFFCFRCFFKFPCFKGRVSRASMKLAKLMVTTMESFASHHSQKSTLCTTFSSNFIETKSVSLIRIDGALQHLRSMSAIYIYIYAVVHHSKTSNLKNYAMATKLKWKCKLVFHLQPAEHSS